MCFFVGFLKQKSIIICLKQRVGACRFVLVGRVFVGVAAFFVWVLLKRNTSPAFWWFFLRKHTRTAAILSGEPPAIPLGDKPYHGYHEGN